MNTSRPLGLIALLLFFGFPQAHAVETPSDRPFVEGMVVDEYGNPIAGVEYWTTAYRLGEDGEGGYIMYSGIVTVRETDESGRFLSPYGGAGRDEQAIDISFRHKDFAPAWLVNVNQAKGPYTVMLEKGLKLSGVVEGNEDFQDGGARLPGKLQLRLDVSNKQTGGSVVGIPIETDNDGWFTVRIPTEYWSCRYRLHFAGTKSELEFDEDKPLPKLRVRVQTEIDQVESVFDL